MDLLMCTGAHSHTVPAGAIIDSAQGPRCPEAGCGALCLRRPCDVLAPADVQELAALSPACAPEALSWQETGRRHYRLTRERGEPADLSAVFWACAPAAPTEEQDAQEIALIRSGWQTEHALSSTR